MATNVGSLRERLALLAPFVVGYALIDAWSQTVFSTSFFAQTTLSDQVIKSLAALVPSLVLLLLSRRIGLLVRRRYREVLYLFGMAASAGTGLLLFVMYGALDAYWTKFTLSMLVIARVCLLVCWWERLAVFPPHDMWLALGCAIVLGAVFNMAPVLVPEVVRNCLVVAAPLVSTVLLPVRDNRDDEGAVKPPAFQLPAGGLSLRKMLTAIPWMLVIVLGLLNIPSEALVYLEMMGDLGLPSESNPLTGAIVRMLVNLTAIALAYFAVRTNISLAIFVAVPVVTGVSFFLALGVNVPFNAMHTVCRIGSEMVRYTVVYLLLSAVAQRRVPALFCFSFMVFVHGTGSALGVFTAFALEGNPTMIAMLFMGILLLAMLLVVADMQRNGPLGAQRSEGGASVMPIGNAVNADKPLAEAATDSASEGPLVAADTIDASAAGAVAVSTNAEQAFAERYGLTRREREVLRLWVRGRTAAYIEEQLCISKYTVKTHVNHIYEKTGVSSKEELMSLVEAFCDPL